MNMYLQCCGLLTLWSDNECIVNYRMCSLSAFSFRKSVPQAQAAEKDANAVFTMGCIWNLLSFDWRTGPSAWAYQKDRLVGIALGILHDVRIGAVNILEKVHKKSLLSFDWRTEPSAWAYLLSCSWQTDSSAGDMSIRFVSEIFLCKIFWRVYHTVVAGSNLAVRWCIGNRAMGCILTGDYELSLIKMWLSCKHFPFLREIHAILIIQTCTESWRKQSEKVFTYIYINAKYIHIYTKTYFLWRWSQCLWRGYQLSFI